jgi:HEAT repeat protein
LFLDPDKLFASSPAEILDAAARGHLGLDHRFLHALADRKEEALPAVVAFAERDLADNPVDLTPEFVALSRHWKAPESVPFFVKYIKEDPEQVPDEAAEALVEIGQPALEPLLELYDELEETESGDVAFILAHLRVKDERILELLLGRLEYDLPDTALLLSIYGDAAAIPKLEKAISGLDKSDVELRKELDDALRTLREVSQDGQPKDTNEPFDIWDLYPEHADPPIDLLSEEERTGLLTHPVASVRAAAATSFFNQELEADDRQKLLDLAQQDESSEVRARAWEALMGSTEETEVVEAMLAAMRKDLPVEERGGLMVGLAPEADRNEVRKAIGELYAIPKGRAKALEAMWRSVHPSFRDNFAKHLDDADLDVRRGAIWGVGYYGIRSEVDRLRKLFDHEELRSDALFAYALATPAEVSRGRMKGLLARIEKDANGLSEMEEELVKAALDERLMLAGKEPVFLQQED